MVSFMYSNIFSGLLCMLIFARMAKSGIVSLFAKNYEQRHKDLNDDLNRKYEERRNLIAKLNEIKSQINSLEYKILCENKRRSDEIKTMTIEHNVKKSIIRRNKIMKMNIKYMDDYLYNMDSESYDNFKEVSKNINLYV